MMHRIQLMALLTTLSVCLCLGFFVPQTAQAQVSTIDTDGKPIKAGETIEGELTGDRFDDLGEPIEGDAQFFDSYYDVYLLEVKAGVTYQITLQSQDFDSLLLLFSKQGLIDLNDDYQTGQQSNDARLVYEATEDQTLIIYANTIMPEETGAYTLSVKSNESS